MKNRQPHRKLHLEDLERRMVLSLMLSIGDNVDAGPVEVGDLHSSDNHNPGQGRGPGGGGGGGGKPKSPAIDLPTVAAHEFGHSLGLEHSNNPDCGSANQPLMCPFYIGESFQLHAEDIARIQALYPEDPESGPSVPASWDSADITYSFTPDGARMESGGRNALFKTLDNAFGSTEVWQPIFADALELWAAASRADGTDVELVFTEVADDGSKFNVSGASQGDSRFGDIRIASHGFDGASGTLAHAYFPPPNGSTAAGDAHFDKAENWQDLRGALSSELTGTGGGRGVQVGAGDMTLLFHEGSQAAHMPAADTDALLAGAFYGLSGTHSTPLRSLIVESAAVPQLPSLTINTDDTPPVSPTENDSSESADIDWNVWNAVHREASDENSVGEIDEVFQSWWTNSDPAEPVIRDVTAQHRD